MGRQTRGYDLEEPAVEYLMSNLPFVVLSRLDVSGHPGRCSLADLLEWQ